MNETAVKIQIRAFKRDQFAFPDAGPRCAKEQGIVVRHLSLHRRQQGLDFFASKGIDLFLLIVLALLVELTDPCRRVLVGVAVLHRLKE